MFYFSTISFCCYIGKCTRCGCLLLQQFSCVRYIYLHVQQKHLSSHTKLGGTGDFGEGEGGNNSIDMILFYGFHQRLLGNNNLRGMRDMILPYDSINRQCHQISPNHDYWCFNPWYWEKRYLTLLYTLYSYKIVLLILGKNWPAFYTLFLSSF